MKNTNSGAGEDLMLLVCRAIVIADCYFNNELNIRNVLKYKTVFQFNIETTPAIVCERPRPRASEVPGGAQNNKYKETTKIATTNNKQTGIRRSSACSARS